MMQYTPTSWGGKREEKAGFDHKMLWLKLAS